jgi:Ca2+-binding EF-hand superfamily protein
MTEETKNNILATKDFMDFPESLNKKCTKEEFHSIMTSHNSDIPIGTVHFRDYPDAETES